MKEFSVTFKDMFNKGIRPWERNPRYTEAMYSCYNLKPDEGGGLTSYDDAYNRLSNPFTGVSIDWPFPQAFLGQDVRVLATATKIYELTNWTLGTAKLTVTEDERWDFIDFGSYLILTNGTKLCIRDYAGAWTANDYTATIPRFSTGCNFNGQIVAGNIQSTWHGCGSGSLIWSRIGHVDFTPDGSNEAGFRNIPWEGDVYRVKKLGKGVVVYCENGIGVLTPFGQTYGWTKLSDMGLDTKGAIGGDDNVHLFMGKDRNLYKIKSDFSVEKLGYRWLLYNEPVNWIVIEYDSIRQEFHISGDIAYVLGEKGLSTCWQSKMATCFSDGHNSYGVFTDTEDSTAYAITDAIDFGLRGMKTLEYIELGGSWSGESQVVEIGVYFRNDANANWAAGPWVTVNPNGVAKVTTTAVEFMIVVYFDSKENVELDYMTARVKASDKRYMRGV